LPGALLGVLFLLHPTAQALLIRAMEPALANPLIYILAGCLLLTGLTIYGFYVGGFKVQQFGWAVYLGALSLWEEWVFRLALPYSLHAMGFNLLAAVLVSNLIFGAAHYFTLRWKWQWCLMACLGGLAFSRQMHGQFDLLLVAGIHWVATFVNTPRLPSPRV
tara:strand:+ start:177 stop:662 length:486 start_codon:yes stop_codon:yes gene_type:complete